jgi:predicted esterase
MQKIILAVCCLAVTSVGLSAAQEGQGKKPAKVDVTGKWKAKVEVGGQTGAPVFKLKQDGAKVTGRYQGLLGEQAVTGTITGEKIELEFTTDQGKVVYTGTVELDSVKGIAKYGDALAGTWTANRQEDRDRAKSEKEKEKAKPTNGVGSITGIEKTTFQYATRGSQKLHLDRIVDSAVKVAGRRPVIIFMYGGGWEGGHRDDWGLVSSLNYLASLGYTVVSIDYRLGIKEAKANGELTRTNGTEMYLRAIQWSVEDLFDATSYILERADEWNIDKKQIVILGGSSGATNSLVAEFNVANDTELARAHLPKDFRYAGVVSMAGAFWLKAGTPLTFKSKPAPIMFFHGAKDQLVTYDEYQGAFAGYGPAYYCRKFSGPDFPKWFIDYPEGDHVVAGTPLIDCQHEIAAFLKRLVRERQQVSIHTVEHDKPPKTFGSLLKFFGDQSSTGADSENKKK